MPDATTEIGAEKWNESNEIGLISFFFNLTVENDENRLFFSVIYIVWLTWLISLQKYEVFQFKI